MITNWKTYGEYGFIKNIIFFIIIPIVGLIIMMKLFYRNRKITDNLATKYDYNKMFSDKIQKFIINIPNIIMNNNLSISDITNYIWTNKDIELLNEINKYDEQKNKQEFKFQAIRLALEIIIVVIIIYSLLNPSNSRFNGKNNVIYIYVLELYVIVKMIMMFIKTSYPSLSTFVISEYFTNQHIDNKLEFYFGTSLVNFTSISVMLYALYVMSGFKNVNVLGWHIILILLLMIYNVISSIYSLKKLSDWKRLSASDINILLINYLLISKTKNKNNEQFNMNELKLILINGIKNSVSSLFNIISYDDELRNDVVNKTIKSLDKSALQKLFKQFGYSINDDSNGTDDSNGKLIPNINIIDNDKSNYKKWINVNKECFNDIKIYENLLEQFTLWIWNFEDVLIDTNSFYRMKMDPDEIRALSDEQLDLQVPHWRYYKKLIEKLIQNGKYVAICSFGIDFIIDAYITRIFGYNQKYFKIGVNIKTIHRHSKTGEPDIRNIVTNKIPLIKELMELYRVNDNDKVILFDNSMQNLACVREIGIIGIKIGENDRTDKVINELNPNNFFHGGMLDYISLNLNEIIKNNKKTRYGSIGGLKSTRRDKQYNHSEKNSSSRINIDDNTSNDDNEITLDHIISKIKCKNEDKNYDKEVETVNPIIPNEEIIQEDTNDFEQEYIKQELNEFKTKYDNLGENENENENFVDINSVTCDKCKSNDEPDSVKIILFLIIIIMFITNLKNGWSQ